jgi:hypothetical protein
MLSKFLTAKLAVIVLTAVVAVGGVAAAASVGKAASEHAKAKAVGKVSKAADDHGPDASGPAKAGLCRAWAAGKGRENGGKADSTAFEALAKAAGGADNVAAFCAGTEAATAAKGKSGDAGAQRPEATDAALAGQCTAWASKGADKRRQDGTEAFKALIQAAGGTANVDAFCTAMQTADTQAPGSSADEQRDAHAPAGTDHTPDVADQHAPTPDA